MMTSRKLIIINKLNLPKELINIIKEYSFRRIKNIPTNDERYNMLLQIPKKRTLRDFYNPLYTITTVNILCLTNNDKEFIFKYFEDTCELYYETHVYVNMVGMSLYNIEITEYDSL